MNECLRKQRDALMQSIKCLMSEQDAYRPRYHLMPPACFMIDTWGGIYLNGDYHMFYDINPFSDGMSEYAAFAHARSSDLVHWENLPLALWPDESADELRVNDGTLALDGEGNPTILYTRVFKDGRARVHLAARGSADLVEWTRMDASNPVLSLENHGGPAFRREWSDPLIFRDAGRTFLLMSKCVTQDGRKQIPIYEATDATLTHWVYRGIFFDDSGEVVNFVKVDGKWVLIYCPYHNPVYHVGDFDITSFQFHAQKSGTLCWGYRQQGNPQTPVSRGLYATSAFHDASGRATLFGWISGFEGTSGWNGCVSIPRVLSLDASGRLLMRPHPAMENLDWHATDASQGTYVFPNGAFRLRARFAVGGVIDLSFNGNSIDSMRIERQESELILSDIHVRVPADACDDIEIILYVDGTVIELFADSGRVSIVQCVPVHSGVVCVRALTVGAQILLAQETQFHLKCDFIQ